VKFRPEPGPGKAFDPEVGDSYALVTGLREPDLFASFIEDLEPAPGP